MRDALWETETTTLTGALFVIALGAGAGTGAAAAAVRRGSSGSNASRSTNHPRPGSPSSHSRTIALYHGAFLTAMSRTRGAEFALISSSRCVGAQLCRVTGERRARLPLVARAHRRGNRPARVTRRVREVPSPQVTFNVGLRALFAFYKLS